MANPPTIDIAELERLEKAATPGPWKWSYQFLSLDAGKEKIIWPSNAQFDPENARESLGACGKQAEPDAEANAALIAALRNAAPALIAALRERDELHAAVEAVAQA